MVERYVTCQVIIGFILITFTMSYFISSTFHPPLQHLPLATMENLAYDHLHSHHLHGPLHDNHYHANRQDILNTQTEDDSTDPQNARRIQEVTAHAKRAEIFCIFKGIAIMREMMTQGMDILEKRQPTHSNDTDKM